jgi:hypothetical protein
MTEEENIQNDIIEALYAFAEYDEPSVEIDNIATFEDAGVLTNNKGLVIRLANGREYQVTIVHSA